MVLDNIRNSTKHLYERFSSPFGGTFITVWIIHHWQLVYSFFTFDDDCTLNDRIYILQHNLSKSDNCDLLWIPLGYTFLVMFSYLLLNNLGYAVILIFEKWAKPIIHFIFDRNKNASREDLDRLKNEVSIAYKQVEEAKDESRLAKEEKNTIEKKYIGSITDISNLKFIQGEREAKIKGQEEELEKTEEGLAKLISEKAELRLQYDSLLKRSKAKLIFNAKEIFDGRWDAYFRIDNKEVSHESFYIDNQNWYFINDENAYQINNMLSFDDGRYLLFTKVREGGIQSSFENIIVKINDGHYVGFEDGSKQVEYKRRKYTAPRFREEAMG